MSDYQNTTFAFAKIRDLKLSYEDLMLLFKLDKLDDLEIVEDPYSKERGSFYLYKELDECPQNIVDMQNLEYEFEQFSGFIIESSFEIKTINWYNAADMPLFEE